MSNNKNTHDFFGNKPNAEFWVKVICALCISTLVILIIISCARSAKADSAESLSKFEFRTNVSPLCQWQADFGTKYYLITKKHL